MSRRRAKANGLAIIYWRDIPAQVTATAQGTTEKVLLEPRFQHAIDRAADVAGLTETEAYVAQWRKTNTPLDDDPKRAAGQQAEELQASYPRDRLEKLVAQGGAETESDAEPSSEHDDRNPTERSNGKRN